MNTIPMNLELFKEKVDNFDKSSDWKFEGNKPAIIEFFATWCPHCRHMKPMIDELAGQFKSQMDFYTVDVDQEQELDSMFGVEGTPTFIFIPLHGEPYEVTGEQTEGFMLEQINNLLNS